MSIDINDFGKELTDDIIELCQSAFEAARECKQIGTIGRIKEPKFETFEDWLDEQQ